MTSVLLDLSVSMVPRITFNAIIREILCLVTFHGKDFKTPMEKI